MTIHVVQRGETVDSIAAAYGVDPIRMAASNDVHNGNLAVGQTLVIRFPREVHAVRSGETLTSIAAAYGVTVRQLWRNNWFLGGNDLLLPDQTLVISYFGEKQGRKIINGYAYPFISERLLRQELPYISALSPFTSGISADGHLLPLNNDFAMRSAALHAQTASVLHLSTLTEDDQFNTERARIILTDYTKQNILLTEILQQVEQNHYAGVDVDFEYLPGYLAGEYAAFLERLHTHLRREGKFLWAALAPKTSAQQSGLLYEGHDYALLGAACDAVLLMTYEWGYTYGPPMAIAPLPNVREVLDYAIMEIPPGKILLGVPNYGYDWPLPYQKGITRAQSISNQKAIELAIQYQIAIQYDTTAQSAFFHYTDKNGIIHEVWFEDARSLQAKYQLMGEYGLVGAGIWNLMRPCSQTWLTLDSLYDIRNI